MPLTSGSEIRVIIGGVMAGSVRSLIETPLEYAKVVLKNLIKYILSNNLIGVS